MKCLYLTVFLLLAPLSLFAEPATLEPVTVTSTRMERPLADTPAAVTVVNADSRLRGQSRLQLDESLNRVPGLYLQNRYNFAQGLRLSSRGFGSRAPFGVRGLRLNVKPCRMASRNWTALICLRWNSSPYCVAQAPCSMATPPVA